MASLNTFRDVVDEAKVHYIDTRRRKLLSRTSDITFQPRFESRELSPIGFKSNPY